MAMMSLMATSVIHAVMERYDALPPAVFPGGVRPPIYLGEAPVSSAGAMLRPPYVVITDQGTRPEYTSDAGAVETARVQVEVYAVELGAVDQIVLAVRFGGQPPGQRAGLDWAALTFGPPYAPTHLMRAAEQRGYAGWDYESRRVHYCRLDYEATVTLEA